MRKLLIFSLILTVFSSCSFSKNNTDFSTLYKNSITEQINRLEQFSEFVGYRRQQSIVGSVKAALQVPVLMSGSLKSNYDIKINHSDMSAMLEGMNLAFESPINTGLVSAKRIGVTSIAGDLYLLMEDFIDEGLFPAEARAIFAKYNNKWLSYTQKDMEDSLSGATAEDIMVSTIAKNISKMGTKDIEKYLTEYPIWKSTADLGMSGSLHVFAIDLDRDMFVSLAKKVTLDLSASPMSQETESALKDNLASLTFSGTLAFDTKDSKTLALNLNIAQSGTPLGKIAFSTSASRTDIQLNSAQDSTDVIFSITGDEKRNDMKLTLMQEKIEVGQLVGYITRDNDALRELSLDVTAQGVSVTFKHTVEKDGSFEGRMTLPVGTLSWNGKMISEKLSALSLKGAMPMGTIDMSLTPDGDILKGPLVLKSGSDEVFRANIGLRIESGIFGLDLDVLNPEGSGSSLTAGIEITHDTKKFDDAIRVPDPTEPLQNLISDLEKLSPPTDDVFTEDTSLENLEPIDTEASVTGAISQ